MFKKHLILFFILVICRYSYSQVDKFSDWLGQWQETYIDNNGNKETEDLTIKWAHYERWMQFDITGYVIEHPEIKWSSSMVLTLDNEHNIVGWYIDNDGYDGMGTIKGTIEDNKLIYKLESLKGSSKSTWEFKDGDLICRGTSKSKESGKTYTNKRVFKKK